MAETLGRLLTAREAAALLSLSVKTLERHRARGVGPHYIKTSVGRSGRVRYRRADIDSWIAGHRRASTKSTARHA